MRKFLGGILLALFLIFGATLNCYAVVTAWYVSALAAGGGDGTSGNPWTLAEAVTAINASTVGNGDTVWIKADGTYTTSGVAITVSGASTASKAIKGYTSTIGDNGRATIQRTTGTSTLFSVTGDYWEVENFYMDSNGGAGSVCVLSSSDTARNIESNGGVNGISASRVLNCYAHNYTNIGLSGQCIYNSIADGGSTGGFGVYNSGFITNTICKNNSSYNIHSYGWVMNCISDGGTGHGIYLYPGAYAINNIIVNSTTGKYGLYIANASQYTVNANNNFYNCVNKCYNDAYLGTYYTLDPQFKDPANLDYTRTGTNLDNLGIKVGLLDSSINYNIDIGPDQKAAGSVSNIIGLVQ